MKNYFKKYVKNDFPCAAKWRWSTIRLFEGQTQSCHRTHSDAIPEDFDSFHNTPIKLKTRKLMQKGLWPDHGCEYCKNLEEVGSPSDRNYYNSTVREKNIPKEIFNNSKAIKLTPTIIEIYFSNLCNMGCIYCRPTESSVWDAEEKKYQGHLTHPEFFNPPFPDVLKQGYQKRVDQMFNWLKKNVRDLTEIHLLGGEPLIQEETFKVLDIIQSKKKTNLDYIAIFSNLKVEKQRFQKVLGQLSEFFETGKVQHVTIVCSIDCWGEEQEYIRTGLNIDKWEENFNILVKDYPKIGIHLHSTMTNLGIKTMSDLIEKQQAYGNFRTQLITHSFSFVDGRPFMHPRIFPEGFFDDDFDKMIEISKNKETIQKLIGFKKYVNNFPYQPELVKQLKQFLDIIDRRRGMNWRETFPWLADFDEDKHK